MSDRYTDGFNDALMLIIMADDSRNWKEAEDSLENYEFAGFLDIEPIKSSLSTVKYIMDIEEIE